MRSTITLLTACIIGLCCGSRTFAADVCATPSNVVANCGFETGDFSNWAISGTDSAPSNSGIYYGVQNVNQYSGNDSAYFGALGGEITLSQTLNNLIVSDIYTITLEAFNDTTPGNYINNLGIILGSSGGQVVSQAAMGGYVKYTIIASAPSASVALAITSRNDAGFWNVDSIQAIQTGTPEPSAFALLSLGLVLGLLVVLARCFSSRLMRPFSPAALRQQ